MNREFEIEPRADGGWRLKLLEGDAEVGGGVFADDDYDAALEQGHAFLGE